MIFFFFQAEDGIRDLTVTGVQTCALPICTLADLFDGKRQLVTYHFMFGPDWGDEGCPACSYVVDNIAGSLVHLAARHTAFAVISRAPLAKITPFKKRRSEEHTSELQSQSNLVCRLLLDKKVTIHEPVSVVL